MLSVLNGPLGLDTVSLPEQAAGANLTGFSGTNGPFSDIMANIQKSAHPVALPETARAPGNLPIPPQLAELVSALAANGNHLPEEASTVLEELQIDFERLLQEGLPPGQQKLPGGLLQRLENALESLEVPAEELTDDLNTEVAAVIEQIRQLLDQAGEGHNGQAQALIQQQDHRSDNAQAAVLTSPGEHVILPESAQQQPGVDVAGNLPNSLNPLDRQLPSGETRPDHGLAETRDSAEVSTQPEQPEMILAENLAPSEPLPVSPEALPDNGAETAPATAPAASGRSEKPQSPDIERPQQAEPVGEQAIPLQAAVIPDPVTFRGSEHQPVSRQFAGGSVKEDGFFKPAATASNLSAGQSALHQQLSAEADAGLESASGINGRTNEMKNLLSNPLMQTDAKNPLPANSSAWLHSQALASKSGSETAFSGMQNNHTGTSFAQMMSQASPAPMMQNIHTPQWGQALGQRIAWMIGHKLQSAQVRITPAHLGPVDIRLSIENNQAQVSFVSQHQVVRDAIELAVPRLREMFEQQNLDLGDVDVSDRRLAQQGEPEDSAGEPGGGHNTVDVAETQDNTMESLDRPVVQLSADGILDAYA